MTLEKIIERFLVLGGLAALLAVVIWAFVMPPLTIFKILIRSSGPLTPSDVTFSYYMSHLPAPTFFLGLLALVLWVLLRWYPTFFRSADGESAPSVAAWQLFLMSCLALYFELLVIRWLSSEIRIMAYFKNLSLLCAFLGLGGGMLLKDKRYDLIPYFPLFFGWLAFLGYSPFGNLMGATKVPVGGIIEMWSNVGELSDVRTMTFYPILLLLIVSQVVFFLPLGQGIGRWMQGYTPLKAYSINIAGSLAGIWLFAVLSFLEFNSLVWFSVGCALWFLLMCFSGYVKTTVVALLVYGATLVGVAVYDREAIWSPYFKIQAVPVYVDTFCTSYYYKAVPAGKIPFGYALVYNDAMFYSTALNGSEEFKQMVKTRYPEHFPCLKNADRRHDAPFEIVSPQGKEVFVVAAGPGDDVASAIRFGARHVDAVDIDPVPIRIGRQYHPERVYASPRVSLFVDDARAYFYKARKKYDYIVFASLDSLGLLSGMSSIRLDNFIYTRESFRAASRLLEPNGIITILLSYHLPTAPSRILHMLRESFPADPILTDDQGNFFMTGPGLNNIGDINSPITVYDRPVRLRMIQPGEKVEIDERLVPTDNWPFFYLNHRHIPDVFFVMGLMLLVCSFLVIQHAQGRVRRIRYDLLLLGTGFLLLETKAVTQMALLYGTTWFVNTVVFTVVLIVILLANWVVARRPRLPLSGLYVGLAASLIVGYYVDIAWLFEYAPFTRGVVSGALLGAPFFFASCVFARVFNELRPDEVGTGLGSNLVGATIGGLVEYSTLLFGFKLLNLFALGFYMLSWLIITRARSA